MNLPAMRTEFRRRTSGLADTMADSDIDERLNYHYQHTIPAKLGGELGEQVWRFKTTVGESDYPYPGPVIAPDSEEAWIDSFENGPSTEYYASPFFLRWETDPACWAAWDIAGDTGRPTRALAYRRTLKLDPTPDAEYWVNVPVMGGPTTGLTADGIANATHAKAIICYAAWEFLVEQEDTDGANAQNVSYMSYEGTLQVFAHARPKVIRNTRNV